MEKLINHTEVEKFRAIIEESDKIVLTCHVRPDGDAVGSILGMMHLLKSLGKEANVVTPDMPPRTLQFLPGIKEISVFTRHDEFSRRLIEEADLIICCDFNKPSRQDKLGPVIRDALAKKVLVDHHQDPDYFCNLTFSYPDMSSTCELVFRLIAAMGYYTEMNKAAATCLLTGIITDTRNFSVNCKNSDIYEILMRLLEKGVDKQMIVKEALETRTMASVKLHAYAISEKMELFEKHRVSIICLDKDELTKFGYEKGDTEGLVNEPLAIRGVVASFFLREDDDCIKVSGRSIDKYPVSKVCEDLFGGGGHLQAAGAEFHGSLADCRNVLIKSLHKYDIFLPSKLPVMGS